jgi:hypothetical protein
MSNWSTESVEELKKLYVENDMTSDRLIKDSIALSQFAAKLNSRLSLPNGFSSEEIATELLKIRKSGKLPRIRR